MYISQIVGVVLIQLGEGNFIPGTQKLTNQPNGADKQQCFDDVIMAFMEKYGLGGASAAMLYDGKIVYSQGYGPRDIPGVSSKSAHRPTLPETPFRLASVSKVITGLTVLVLAQDGKLSLDDQIVPKLERLKGWKFLPMDPNANQITVRQVLSHSSGLKPGIMIEKQRNIFQDAYNRGAAGPTCLHVLGYTLQTTLLEFQPGSKFAYSNVGFCALGLLIEAVTGKSYGDAVTEHVLQPASVDLREFYLARSHLSSIPDEEAQYGCPQGRLPNAFVTKCPTKPSIFREDGGAPVMTPYGSHSMELAGPAGGWVASARQLMKVLRMVSSPNCGGSNSGVNDQACLLNPSTYLDMVSKPTHGGTASKPGVWYGLGVRVDNQGNAFHDGTIDGSSTMIRYNKSGYGMALLFNSDRLSPDDIDAAMIEAVSCLVPLAGSTTTTSTSGGGGAVGGDTATTTTTTTTTTGDHLISQAATLEQNLMSCALVFLCVSFLMQ